MTIFEKSGKIYGIDKIAAGNEMQNPIPFDPYQQNYKFPFGSVRAGTAVRFAVCLPRAMGCSSVTLLINEAFSGRENAVALSWRETDQITEWWECVFTPREEGVYRYSFEYRVSWGTGTIAPDENDAGSFSAAGSNWQLTVYSPDFHTPDWLKGGLIYQIFPDRFAFSDQPKEKVPSDRILRKDRDALPYWKPDEKGIIRNNDYFGGDLRGIEEKLPYLKSLGVTCLYLNPIFEAHSNHRYDTANYFQIDPLLGNEADFRSLCREAKRLGISVLFDGVFSHTGADSVYFNKYRRYGNSGAYNDPNSPYRPWYHFGKDKDDYHGWWGIDTLPEVNENEPSYTAFITGENGVIDHWLQAGARGVRLDVADELPDAFIDRIREIVKKDGRDAFLLGEVWEDATNKVSWGSLRRYLLGKQLDSVMNYPFRTAILDFVKFADAECFMRRVLRLIDHYPPEAMNTAMNLLGTHDTARLLTVLSDLDLSNQDRDYQASLFLTDEQKKLASRRCRAAAVLQYTLPGVPSLYYGDEAGMQGGRDPFNRGCFPWEKEDKRMLEHYRALGALRQAHTVLRDGAFRPLSATLRCAAFLRENQEETLAVLANMNPHDITYYITIPHEKEEVLLGGSRADGGIAIPPLTTAVVRIR